jgi:hypothetical protein
VAVIEQYLAFKKWDLLGGIRPPGEGNVLEGECRSLVYVSVSVSDSLSPHPLSPLSVSSLNFV